MKGGRKNMKITTLCIPKLKTNNNNNNHTNTTQWLSPISLLERFREAVFRLIMLTAMSKTTRHQNDSDNNTSVPRSRSYYPPDQHQSDAVADCIEFIKKSSSPHDENCDSSARSSIESDDDHQVALSGQLCQC